MMATDDFSGFMEKKCILSCQLSVTLKPWNNVIVLIWFLGIEFCLKGLRIWLIFIADFLM